MITITIFASLFFGLFCGWLGGAGGAIIATIVISIGIAACSFAVHGAYSILYLVVFIPIILLCGSIGGAIVAIIKKISLSQQISESETVFSTVDTMDSPKNSSETSEL